MLTRLVVSIVGFCTRFAIPTVLVAVIATACAGVYAVQNFAINTDINKLISPDLDWRQRDIAFEKAFDQERLIIAVVEAPTPEFASAAGAALEKKLRENHVNFESVQRLGGGPFFEKNGLLFLPTAEVAQVTGQFEAAAPLLEVIAGDPTLRGLTGALEIALTGVKRGQFPLDTAARPLDAIAGAVEHILDKGSATFSWRELVSDKPLTDADKRAFIEVKPILNFDELEPGKAATDAIRKAANDINLAGEFSARVRLTGPVPIANEEFATVQEGALVNGIGTVLVVLFILWLALRSPKIIFAVATTLTIGLAITTAAGLM
ncbi:MAG: MMPL family transporter, partial [Xanthobacteraceae bacterium]